MSRKRQRQPEVKQGSVLIVDDSAAVRAIVGGLLRDAGYVVQEAEDGASALRLIEGGGFDVVISDLRMPEVDGFEVLEAVKSRALGPEVVILTGTHAKDMNCAIRALRLGAHDFLTKPSAHPEEVVLTVNRAVEKKRLRDANMRLLRELAALSRTDPLTGLLNRRAFDEALRREAQRARRHGFPLALAMFDLDHFKRINDSHGHEVGDAALRWFSRLAETTFRDSDTIHRYGGEEFAMLLPHTPLEGALDATRRLVALTAETPFRHGSLVLKVTASAGVACAQGPNVDRGQLLQAADAKLYEAKQAGRNRGFGGVGSPRLHVARRKTR